MPEPGEVTRLLQDWCNGDQAALEKLMPLIYGELHNLAARYLRRENPGHSLQATALVNEAYLRLIGQHNVRWQNRMHFFAIAAQMMRCILVNYARDKHRAKRGGKVHRVTLDERIAFEERDLDLVALDDALNLLAEVDGRKSRLVELRFFAGLTIEETAEVLGISVATAKRDWMMARVWLYRKIKKEDRHDT